MFSLAGVNDSLADAAHLVSLLHGIRFKVNIIPFNPFPGAAHALPPPAVVDRFKHRLFAQHPRFRPRHPRPRPHAACGRLAAIRQGLLAS
jgi:23S rRNA (adenine2503-C2)-methyltransferase